MTGQRGFVLVNALVLVAALAAAAVYMLSRAEGVRARGEAALDAVQLGLYLDAVEVAAMEMLANDAAGGSPVDHLAESWARRLPVIGLDRGRVTGQINDLQGRFNINRLANPADELARESFERLAVRLGLSPLLVEEVVDLVSADGPENKGDYARGEPPVLPVGGALLMREQLKMIPILDAEDYARLAPFVAAIPGASKVNVNTAPGEVLASLLPGANAAGLDRLVQLARREPFGSEAAFIEALIEIMPEEDLAEFPEGVLGVGSTWFEVEIDAELDGRVAHRRAVIERLPLPQGARVAYRLDSWN